MKKLLAEIIKEWWRWPLPEVKPRKVDLSSFSDAKIKKILAVIGFRRVGKTFLLLDFARRTGQNNCVYLNFEDERIPARTEILTDLIEVVTEIGGRKRFTLLLDEIQNIPNWSKWARRVNETTGHSLVLSGSSSRLSSREIPTELRGRTLSIEVSPLNFPEFLGFKECDGGRLPEAELQHVLREYLTYGGFPEIVMVEEGKRQLLLNEYFQTFLLRDIFDRYRPRQESAVRDTIRILLNSSYITIGKLANTLGTFGYNIGKSTVSNYLHWLEEAFFIRQLEFHSPRVKDRIQYPKKIYFVDNYFVSRFASGFSDNLGRLMENLAARQLFAKADANPDLELFYWKDYSGREVDFVVKEGMRVTDLIQVTYASDAHDIAEREIKSLERASKELKCDRATMVTWNYDGTTRADGLTIRFCPLARWLEL